MRNRYKGKCEACGKEVLPKQGRWRMIPKQTQNFTGLRCLECSTTTKKKHMNKTNHNSHEENIIETRMEDIRENQKSMNNGLIYNSHEGEEKCECVCHFIYPVKRGEAFPRQFDRPIGCEHCTSQNSYEGEEKLKE